MMRFIKGRSRCLRMLFEQRLFPGTRPTFTCTELLQEYIERRLTTFNFEHSFFLEFCYIQFLYIFFIIIQKDNK